MTEFDDLLAEYIDAQQGDIIPAVLAKRFITKIKRSNPKLLENWLHIYAEIFITRAITHRVGQRRRTARAREFSDAAQRFESGDEHALDHFTQRYKVDDENTQRMVGDMTGPDHLYVADHYRYTHQKAAMLEAFHRAVARKIGGRKTKDVLSEEEYARLLHNVGARHA